MSPLCFTYVGKKKGFLALFEAASANWTVASYASLFCLSVCLSALSEGSIWPNTTFAPWVCLVHHQEAFIFYTINYFVTCTEVLVGSLPVMHVSGIGFGINSGMIPLLLGTGIGIVSHCQHKKCPSELHIFSLKWQWLIYKIQMESTYY